MDLLMILVSLGTQDRSFKRLLEAVERQIELGNIQEKVIVQAGETKYESDVMEIFDLIPSSEFLKLLDECSLLITHGGVGTIIDGLHHHKKIIAAARLKEYGEHQNNHQKQIIHEFVDKHYILELDDFDRLDEKLKEIETFEPKEYESNTTHFITLLEQYIDQPQHQGSDFYRMFLLNGFYTFFALLIQSFLLLFLQSKGWGILNSLCLSQVTLIGYRFLLHFLFYTKEKWNVKSELLFVSVLMIQILFVFLAPNYFQTYFVLKMLGIGFLSFLLVTILSYFGRLEKY